MQKLFKNANLVDVKNGQVNAVDILIENNTIKDIKNLGELSNQKGGIETFDLQGGYVLPPFVNVFCHSIDAFQKNYEEINQFDCNIVNLVQKLMTIKNIFAGAIYNDVAAKNEFNCVFVDKFEEKSEQELSEIVSTVAKNQNKLFIEAGKTLEELGTVDLLYKKSLPQVLEDFGYLDREPVIVGGNCFEKDDFELFSQYDCSFCLTPSDDGKSGVRPTNFISLQSKDFCVGLGSGKSFEIDFFAFMRQLIMTQRGLFENADCIEEKEVFEVATYNGAKILGLEKYGVEKGKFANFIVVSGGKSLYDDVLKTLVWEKSKKDVFMTVHNGEILQKNGKILMKNMPDYDTIINEILQILRRK